MTCEGSRTLIIVDPGSGKVERAIETGRETTHMAVLAADGSRVFTANIGSDTVTAMDLASWKVTGSFSTGDEPDGMAWSPAQGD